MTSGCVLGGADGSKLVRGSAAPRALGGNGGSGGGAPGGAGEAAHTRAGVPAVRVRAGASASAVWLPPVQARGAGLVTSTSPRPGVMAPWGAVAVSWVASGVGGRREARAPPPSTPGGAGGARPPPAHPGAPPPPHADPFDRARVAQARGEGATLVSHARALAPSRLPMIWT